MALEDWRGTPIEVGSTVVYATTVSSIVTMNEAVVDEIEWVGRPDYWAKQKGLDKSPILWVKKTRESGGMYAPPGKRVKLTVIGRVVVVPPS